MRTRTGIFALLAVTVALLLAGSLFSFFYIGSCPSVRPSALDIKDDENFVMLEGEQLKTLIPRSVERVVFSDCTSPYTAELTDLSERGLGGVVAWEEGGVYYISTRVPGRRAILPENVAGAFSNCKRLRSIDLSMLDTSRARDLMRLFYGCSSLESLDLSAFRFENAVRLRSMLMGCTALRSVTFGEVDTSGVKDIAFMFSDTPSLSSLDLSDWDLSSVMCSTAMLQSTGCKEIRLPDSLTRYDAFFLNHASAYTGESFTLPKDVCEVGLAHLFYDFGTDAFSAFLVEEGSGALLAEDGVLYSADGSKLLAVPKGKRFEKGIFEIAEGVTFLGELSFSRNPYITTLLLPNSYRVSFYDAVDHPDYSDVNGSGNKNTGSSLNLAIYIYTNVREYAVKEDNPFYTSVGGALYERGEGKEAVALVAVPLGYTGDLVIPEGTERIAREAFWETDGALFSSLNSVHIPASLVDIPAEQLRVLNALGVRITVASDNPVFKISSSGVLLEKSHP